MLGALQHFHSLLSFSYYYSRSILNHGKTGNDIISTLYYCSIVLVLRTIVLRILLVDCKAASQVISQHQLDHRMNIISFVFGSLLNYIYNVSKHVEFVCNQELLMNSHHNYIVVIHRGNESFYIALHLHLINKNDSLLFASMSFFCKCLSKLERKRTSMSF